MGEILKTKCSIATWPLQWLYPITYCCILVISLALISSSGNRLTCLKTSFRDSMANFLGDFTSSGQDQTRGCQPTQEQPGEGKEAPTCSSSDTDTRPVPLVFCASSRGCLEFARAFATHVKYFATAGRIPGPLSWKILSVIS